jgi:hypothetical protein
MDDPGVHAIAGIFSPTDDSAENFLITRKSNVGHILHQKSPRHHLLNHSEEGLPKFTASFIQLPMLINYTLVMLSPTNVA